MRCDHLSATKMWVSLQLCPFNQVNSMLKPVQKHNNHSALCDCARTASVKCGALCLCPYIICKHRHPSSSHARSGVFVRRLKRPLVSGLGQALTGRTRSTDRFLPSSVTYVAVCGRFKYVIPRLIFYDAAHNDCPKQLATGSAGSSSGPGSLLTGAWIMDAVVRTKLNNQSLHSSLPGDRCDGVVLFMSLCSAFGRSVFLKYEINKLTKKTLYCWTWC